MSFFKLEDFDIILHNYHQDILRAVVSCANAKLERDLANKLYEEAISESDNFTRMYRGSDTKRWCEHIANNFLTPCKHPENKLHGFVKWTEEKYGAGLAFRIEKLELTCECGAKVRPTSFEEIK